MPDTVIARVDALGKGKPYYLNFLDNNKRPIGDIGTTEVGTRETESPKIDLIELETDLGPISATESPHIYLIEPETDINTISANTGTLPELVERQDIPNIDIEQYMFIEKENVTLEVEEQIIDPAVP